METSYEHMVQMDHKVEIDNEVDTISYLHQKELAENKNVPPEIPTGHLPDNLLVNQFW